MKRKIIFSMVVILFVMATSFGATLAWFTDEAQIGPNVFEAGTVEIQAEEEWAYDGLVKENWNPNDCDEKEFIVTNTGSKDIEIRGKIRGQWYDEDGETEWTEPGDAAVEIKFVEGTNWSIEGPDEDGYYHLLYDGSIPGTYSRDNDDNISDADLVARVTIEVCLDGELANNDYQGKVFKLYTSFQAIQASHKGGDDGWNWDDFEDYN